MAVMISSGDGIDLAAASAQPRSSCVARRSARLDQLLSPVRILVKGMHEACARSE